MVKRKEPYGLFGRRCQDVHTQSESDKNLFEFKIKLLN
jgi:hypothetical protein